MKTYNKLIRDNIPNIIKDSGKTCKTRILNDADYKHELKMKVIEEAKELVEANDLESLKEELADIEELLYHIKKAYSIKDDTITLLREKKNKTNGAFNKKLFLETVDNK